MRPVTLSILGDFWDCQVYRGRMYLFTMNGSIKVINWNKLINFLSERESNLRIAFKYCFEYGKELYSNSSIMLLQDVDVKNVLIGKFDKLAEQEFIIDESLLQLFSMGEQDSPFKELHTDCSIINNRIYALTHNSLASASVHNARSRKTVSTRTRKHLDVYGFSCKGNKYGKLAVSAGSDGLWEYNTTNSQYNFPFSLLDDDTRIVSERHSSFSDFSLLSIYNSSLISDSFLAFQFWSEEKNSEGKNHLVKGREIEEQQIFDAHNIESYLSWGTAEKIYRAVKDGIEIVNFNNYAAEEEFYFSDYNFIHLQPWKGRVLSGATAYFGTIVQLEHALVVLRSDGEIETIPGEVSRFRIYPRSINYENHLHVVLEDRIEVYSFNHDYFINQKQKTFGIEFKEERPFSGSR